MNEKFYDLPQEKQLAIVNAGFEVFGRNEYKKASTEEIATKASISKGLLFYYFKNKKEFYFYLFDYSVDIFNKALDNENLLKITDFFEMCRFATNKKFLILLRFPRINDFILKAFYSKDEEISQELNRRITKIYSTIFPDYMANIDFSKFKKEINPQDILEMLICTVEGYLFEQQRCSIDISMDELMKKYEYWTKLIKEIAYKEEYI